MTIIDYKKKSLILKLSVIIWIGSLALWVECSPMFREIVVQFQVESYQKNFLKNGTYTGHRPSG